MFAAAALTLNKNIPSETKVFQIIICSLGIFISLAIFLGVLMGIKAKHQNFMDEREKQRRMEYETDPLQWWVRTQFTKKALIPDKLMPIAFAAAWVVLLYTLL